MVTEGKLTLGVIGVGVVGGALHKWFKEHTSHNVVAFDTDPEKNFNDDMSNCDATFICVPVPTTEEGQQDTTYLQDALARATGIKFIRSTVLPGTNDRFGSYSCPEFLTERTAYQDTCKMDMLCGHPDRGLVKRIFPGKEIKFMTNKECELAKYAHNSFGAMKVNYFNIIYDICKAEGVSYNKVMEGVLLSGYINDVHTQVPGPDGKFGFGGTCFPKDLRAFYYKYPFMSFASCMAENNKFREQPVTDL
jgi:UDPglucose 6-dehydrogenase